MPSQIVPRADDAGQFRPHGCGLRRLHAKQNDAACIRKLCAPRQLAEILVESENYRPVLYRARQHLLVSNSRSNFVHPIHDVSLESQCFYRRSWKVLVREKAHASRRDREYFFRGETIVGIDKAGCNVGGLKARVVLQYLRFVPSNCQEFNDEFD